MKLEQKIKEIRERAELSQEKFAEKLGVSRQTVINWEKGTTPTTYLLLEIAKEFHIDFSSLVNEDKELSYIVDVEKRKVKSASEISPQLPFESPLHISKKSIFSISILSLVSLFIFIIGVVGYFFYLSFTLRDSVILWIVSTFFLILTFYLGLKIIYMIIELKAKKIYFYKNYLIFQSGVLEKHFDRYPIDFLKEIRIHQTPFSKFFNFGNVEIKFEASNINAYGIKKPYALKRFLLKAYTSKADFTE
ncbi:MAG: helix-turn-helix domain-containing protein [Anaeroplasmataceae bacterium]|nr:helix-turn-helix domain-containing protein [Anaeroplasmataceae bacterium]